MKLGDRHLSDVELVSDLDGELSTADRAWLASHLDACGSCRARRETLRNTIDEFVRAHRRHHAGMPPAEGPRLLLKARMDAAAGQARPSPWREWLRPMRHAKRWIPVTAALLV